VIVAAPGEAAGGRVRVDRGAFSAPGGEGAVFSLDGSEEPADGIEREFSLNANEVAVWVL